MNSRRQSARRVQAEEARARRPATEVTEVRRAQAELRAALSIARRAKHAATQSERYARYLFESSPDGLILCRKDGTILEANRTFARMIGRGAGALPGLNVDDLMPAASAPLSSKLNSLIVSGQPVTLEWPCLHKQGYRLSVRLACALIGKAGQDTVSLRIEDLSASTPPSDTLSQCHPRVLEVLATGGTLPWVLEALALSIEAQSPGTVCSILLLDDHGRSLRVGAAPSLPEAYIRALDGLEVSACDCGLALSCRDPIFIDDLANQPPGAPWRDLVLQYGLRSCWSAPILSAENRVIGTCALYWRDSHQPGQRDAILLKTAADLAGSAVNRKRAEESAASRDDRVRVQQATLVQLAKRPEFHHGDSSAALRVITETAARTLDVERVSLWLLDAERSRIRRLDRYDRGSERHEVGPERLAEYDQHVACFADARVIATSDSKSDPMVTLLAEWSVIPADAAAVLVAPIRVGDSLMGFISHEHRGTSRSWSPEEQQFAGSMADFSALALQSAERRRATEAVQARDEAVRHLLIQREELARDLHDGIIQSIYAVGLGLEECRRLVKEGSPAAVQELSTSIAALNHVIQEVRNSLVGNPPIMRDGLELELELERMVGIINTAGAIRFTLRIDPAATGCVTPDEAAQICRIAQEAMTNSVRHSGGKSGMVWLRKARGKVRLEILDDGVGFDPRLTRERWRGLKNLAARAQRLGSRLQVSSAPGKFTRILVSIPKETVNAPA